MAEPLLREKVDSGMKTISLLLALVLAACAPMNDPYYGDGYPPEPYPPASPYPPEPYPSYPQPGYPAPTPPPAYPGDERYRAIGTEPFWDLRIGRDLVFTDRGTNLTVTQPAPQPIIGFAGEIYRTQRIEANITHTNCSDGMSDRTYPDTVHVRVDGRDYRGCGAASSFFEAFDERGQPVPPPIADPGDMVPLDRTRWRVVSMNGRPTPRTGDFSMQFEDGRLSAKFGCNGMGASYTQSGATLDAGPVMGTKMACPDMSWETQGGAILGQVMTVRMIDRNRLTLDSGAGTIELVRA